MPPPIPTHKLSDVHTALQQSRYLLTKSAREGAAALYLDEGDILACVAGLSEADFFKTMASIKKPGTFQDVYRPRYCGFAIYLKLQLDANSAVVISFKRDESA